MVTRPKPDDRLESGRRFRRVRRPLTGRALILGAVLVLLVVLLAAPLHRFLTARSALAQSVAQRDDGQRQLKQLQQLDQQLNDPAYIEAQARTRLQYAMPGDTVYQVVEPGQQSEHRQQHHQEHQHDHDRRRHLERAALGQHRVG